MTDLVDIAIPANGQTAGETLGLKVERNVTSRRPNKVTTPRTVRLETWPFFIPLRT
jgi:hypothetical protein